MVLTLSVRTRHPAEGGLGLASPQGPVCALASCPSTPKAGGLEPHTVPAVCPFHNPHKLEGHLDV